ncbi:MAG: SIS domain-containing protein [Euzebyales bacterium]|nr:SIS domain-containing protein [Euzebyales bacterium]MBA3621727.1 SIS domain-containing protein [Euzebyales bacterium]
MRMQDMELKWDNMRRGIDGQADLLRTAPQALYAELREVLPGPAPSRLYLVGCGDSHYCGIAARWAIESWTGLSSEALESLEFSRYAVRTAPADALVVAVSNSGEVARSVECLKFAQQQGIPTLGVTYNPDGRLARFSDSVLRYDYRDVGFGPGTMSYLASVLALMVTGLRVAELNGAMDVAAVEHQLEVIADLGAAMEATVKACELPARELGERMQEHDDIFLVGGGPNYGTALFAMAKMIESSRHNSVAQELEEWAHEQYFVCREGTWTVVFAPQGAAVDRAREQLRAVRDVEGMAVVACDADDEETAALADVALPVTCGGDELLSPLLYCAPAELLAYHFAVRNGKVMLGFDDAHRKQVNFRQIFDSNIPSEIPDLGRRA